MLIRKTGLDTANFLLQQDNNSDVTWILALLRSKFPEAMGVSEESTLEQAKAQATSLDLLARLGFA
jgi:hypothetical protein